MARAVDHVSGDAGPRKDAGLTTYRVAYGRGNRHGERLAPQEAAGMHSTAALLASCAGTVAPASVENLFNAAAGQRVKAAPLVGPAPTPLHDLRHALANPDKMARAAAECRALELLEERRMARAEELIEGGVS